MFEFMGWVALSLNVWGNLALAKKSKIGWLVRLACNFAWVIYSYKFAVWPLLANHILFAGINIYGWREWSKGHYRCDCGRDWVMEKFQTRCICEAVIPGLEPTNDN